MYMSVFDVLCKKRLILCRNHEAIPKFMEIIMLLVGSLLYRESYALAKLSFPCYCICIFFSRVVTSKEGDLG